MVRSKMTSYLAVLAVAIGGVSAYVQAQQCNLKEGPPSGACSGDNVAIDCGSCGAWAPDTDGVSWSNAIARGTDMGTDLVGTTVISCRTDFPCYSMPIVFAQCKDDLCRSTSLLAVCDARIVGTAVVTTYTTHNTVACPAGG